jgi:putative nucleotidyltransferase with HDIG domain
MLLDAGTPRLETVASLGFHAPAVDRLRVRVGDGAIGRAALDCRPVLVADLAADAGASEAPSIIRDDGIRGLCAVPLVAKGRLVGVLGVAQRTPLAPSDDWLDFLQSLAGQAAVAIDAGRAFEALQRSHLDLALAYETTIEGWAAALDLRDRETADHTVRVAELTTDLARSAGIVGDDLVQVRRGALLHDIGKMAIPDAILLKKDRLTDDELTVMKRHPLLAYELLAPIGFLRPALDIPYCHHERWDGGGYPRGLKGDDIPFAARLFAVVDVWDAIRSARPYREGWSDERAREHLQHLAGTHLDPAAVGLFLALLDARGHHDASAAPSPNSSV